MPITKILRPHRISEMVKTTHLKFGASMDAVHEVLACKRQITCKGSVAGVRGNRGRFWNFGTASHFWNE